MRRQIELEEAVELVCAAVRPLEGEQQAELLQSMGRVLARDMVSTRPNPPFDRSPVDGYACRSTDLAQAAPETPARLRVVAEVDAGGWYTGTVAPGECVRIMTGGAIPAGCDCVQWQEQTNYAEDVVEIYAPVPPHGNYCFAGEDYPAGALLLPAGTRIGAVEVGILAGLGLDRVPVRPRPRVALLTTGDEVTAPGQPLAPGRIYNQNLWMTAARLTELGAELTAARQLPDDAAAVAQAVQEAAAGADLVLTTGGVSVGKKDILHEVTARLETEPVFWKIRMKPGSPALFWQWAGVPVLSLSGNPFGAAAHTELLVRPMLARLTGCPALEPVRSTAVLRSAFGKASPNRRFVRGICRDGQVTLPQGLHASGVLSSMRGCNCMLDLPAGSPPLTPGQQVEVVMLG